MRKTQLSSKPVASKASKGKGEKQSKSSSKNLHKNIKTQKQSHQNSKDEKTAANAQAVPAKVVSAYQDGKNTTLSFEIKPGVVAKIKVNNSVIKNHSVVYRGTKEDMRDFLAARDEKQYPQIFHDIKKYDPTFYEAIKVKRNLFSSFDPDPVQLQVPTTPPAIQYRRERRVRHNQTSTVVRSTSDIPADVRGQAIAVNQLMEPDAPMNPGKIPDRQLCNLDEDLYNGTPTQPSQPSRSQEITRTLTEKIDSSPLEKTQPMDFAEETQSSNSNSNSNSSSNNTNSSRRGSGAFSPTLFKMSSQAISSGRQKTMSRPLSPEIVQPRSHARTMNVADTTATHDKNSKKRSYTETLGLTAFDSASPRNKRLKADAKSVDSEQAQSKQPKL